MASEMLSRITDRCAQVMGGTAASTETVIEQVFRENPSFRTHDGPTEVHKRSLDKKIKCEALTSHSPGAA